MNQRTREKKMTRKCHCFLHTDIGWKFLSIMAKNNDDAQWTTLVTVDNTANDKLPLADKACTVFALNNTTAYVVEKPACPMGFVCDSYAITDEVYELPLEQRALALLQAPVVAPADEETVRAYAQRLDTNDMDFLAYEEDLVSRASSHAVSNFWRDDHGFGFSANTPKAALAYLSVPHDEGWAAYVDGSEATIIDSAGMMLLPLTEGTHDVRFSYQTPGLRAGLVITGVAWAAFAAAAWIVARSRHAE